MNLQFSKGDKANGKLNGIRGGQSTTFFNRHDCLNKYFCTPHVCPFPDIIQTVNGTRETGLLDALDEEVSQEFGGFGSRL
ncbi:unnamed protein product [Gongylonema pulchrum]|uniref:Uncharacterized protein n=1 Tax=Gongylonema pulchrum TaxID=637853 RepID=A0A183DP74_9BILA|nr:unnamed protein product [Gongylonema pulchrum]